ncbi:hypothetical protein BO78DRAFT_428820 [Aspergillus sclerotiicarbonarius CBS 121057]|uniref:Oxidase ustYa n=1 Tax=Aspergillus sclerotiicarbonarius (strain CBS 121057 / IBT 28362) TaxID=1448318 RepID=A0A319ELY9_ASPSB|nr:hypothetical protein BO78DRAFT_428820 [Aspergillus sclerotiicarbonarius CBS 121057]
MSTHPTRPNFSYHLTPKADTDEALSHEPSQKTSFWKTCFWISLLLTILQIPALFFTANQNELSSQPSPTNIHTTKITFEPDPHFQNLTTQEDVLAAWSIHNLPGLINLPDPTPGKHVYILSAFHQLLCLRTIHLSLFQLQNGISQPVDNDQITTCFNYLRHGIMCAGDVALEGPDPDTEGGGAQRGLTGKGQVHECKVWEEIVEWQVGHGVHNDQIYI